MSPLVVLVIFNLSLLVGANESPKLDLKSLNGWKLRRILTEKLHGALTEINDLPENVMNIGVRIDNYLLGSDSTDFLEHYVANNKKVNVVDMLKNFAEFYGKDHARHDDAVRLYDFLESHFKKQKPDEPKISKPTPTPTTPKQVEKPKEASDEPWRGKTNDVAHAMFKKPDTIDSLLNRMQEVLRMSVSEMKRLVKFSNISKLQENNHVSPPCQQSQTLPQYLGSVYDDVADFYDKTNTAYQERRRKKKPNRRIYLVFEDGEKDQMNNRRSEDGRRFLNYDNPYFDNEDNILRHFISYLALNANAQQQEYKEDFIDIEDLYRG